MPQFTSKYLCSILVEQSTQITSAFVAAHYRVPWSYQERWQCPTPLPVSICTQWRAAEFPVRRVSRQCGWWGPCTRVVEGSRRCWRRSLYRVARSQGTGVSTGSGHESGDRSANAGTCVWRLVSCRAGYGGFASWFAWLWVLLVGLWWSSVWELGEYAAASWDVEESNGEWTLALAFTETAVEVRWQTQTDCSRWE